jgi:DNA invertase Pin-like site-specific DNA recombinase
MICLRIRSANSVRLVLVEWADRLARDVMVSEVLLAEFHKLDVAAISAESGADLTTGDDDPRYCPK